MLGALFLPVVVALLLSLVANRVAISVARRLSFLDRPGTESHKLHQSAVPYGGGVAMAVAVGAAMAVIAWQSRSMPPDPTPPSDGGSFLPIYLGAVALFGVGLLDDIRPMPALAKLGAQGFIAAVVIASTDLGIDSLRGMPVLYYGLTWAWLVLITNAFNLLDHADGLCGSIASISALVLFAGAMLSGDAALAQLCLVLAATLAGFLVWNLPPARIYMGDAGALPLGFLLGAATLSVTFWPSGVSGSPLAILSPVLITALPLFDTATVVVMRLRRHRPLMVGDRSHLGHRLGRLGFTPRRSLLTAITLQVALSAGALQLRTDDLLTGLVVLAQSAAIFLAVVFLETSRNADA
jgi:UDP-GlcNAc:undecaprenyl-phosphate GlcNAc-1-phosphate transferase